MLEYDYSTVEHGNSILFQRCVIYFILIQDTGTKKGSKGFLRIRNIYAGDVTLPLVVYPEVSRLYEKESAIFTGGRLKSFVSQPFNTVLYVLMDTHEMSEMMIILLVK